MRATSGVDSHFTDITCMGWHGYCLCYVTCNGLYGYCHRHYTCCIL